MFQRAVANGPRHAYIVGGPEHVGKWTLAQAFAQALLCSNQPASGTACGHCSTCRRIERGVHPDVARFDLDRQEIEDKGTGKHAALTIQTVRAVTASLSLRPMEGAWRVVIVDDVETMQAPAQEAFLKSLEEPPPYAVILMLVTDPDLLLSTVRSRCQIVQLQPIAVSTISACLRAAGVDAPLADTLAGLSEGLPGWSFRAANEPSLRESRAELQRDAARWMGSTLYDRLVVAMQTAEQFGRDRSGVLERLDVLLGTWRSLLLKRAGALPESQAHVPDMVDQLSVARCGVAELVAAVKSVQTCRSDLLSNVRPRLALESMVLDWPTLISAE